MKHEQVDKLTGIPHPCVSHNILIPEETTSLSPFAAVRCSGQLHNTAKSAVRALEIVELLCRGGKPLRAYEIAGAIGLSSSSADQLLKTLVDSAYLIFDPDSKCYHFSPRLAQIGAPLVTAYFSDGALRRLMDAVYRDLEQLVHIEMMHVMTSQGTYMQILDERLVDSPQPSLGQPESIGMRIPLFGSSSGAAWLATQTDEIVCAAIARCNRELGIWAKEPSRILHAVQRVRTQGFAIGGITVGNDLCGIAVALPKAKSGITLVLTVTAPKFELKEKQTKIVNALNARICEILT
jgi:DNA-binding IclR family transcriptional regulator